MYTCTCFSIYFNFHSVICSAEILAGCGSLGHSAEVLWEEGGNVVVFIVCLVEFPVGFGVIVPGVTIASVGVAVVVNDGVVGVMLPLELLVVSVVTVGKSIRVSLGEVVHKIHAFLVDGVVLETSVKLEESSGLWGIRLNETFSWDGAEMLGEKILNVVILVMGFVEHVMVCFLEMVKHIIWIVWSVSVSGVSVTVEIDDHVVGISFPFELFIISVVTIGELIRVSSQVSNVWPLFTSLEHSDLTSSVPAATESEILDNIVFGIGSIIELLIISCVSIAKIFTWLFLRLSFGLGVEHSVQLSVGH